MRLCTKEWHKTVFAISVMLDLSSDYSEATVASLKSWCFERQLWRWIFRAPVPSPLCSAALCCALLLCCAPPSVLPAVLRYGRKRCAKCTMALLVTALSITCTLHSNSWAPMHNVLHISMSEYGAQCKCHWESWHCLPMGANNLVNWLPDLVLSRCISKIYQNLSIDVTNYWNQGIRH